MDTPFETHESEIRGYCRAYPTVFESASNARMVDEAGTSYIDFFAGAGVLNFGHNDERMKRAMIAFLEADGVAHSLDTYTTTKRTFVERFAEVILEPRDMDHKMQFMGPTGTNAVEAALKLARIATGRDHVVAFSHGFHGMTLGALALTANDAFRQWAGVPLEHVVRLPNVSAPGGGVQAIDDYRAALEDASSGQLPPAAFMVEVDPGRGRRPRRHRGVVARRPGRWRTTSARCSSSTTSRPAAAARVRTSASTAWASTPTSSRWPRGSAASVHRSR